MRGLLLSGEIKTDLRWNVLFELERLRIRYIMLILNNLNYSV